MILQLLWSLNIIMDQLGVSDQIRQGVHHILLVFQMISFAHFTRYISLFVSSRMQNVQSTQRLQGRFTPRNGIVEVCARLGVISTFAVRKLRLT